VPAPGVPLKTPPEVSVTPTGSAPVSLNVGTGKPDAATWNVPAAPTAKAVLVPLVNTGVWSTVRVKLCVAFGVTPFCAVMVIEYTPPVVAPGVPLRTPPEVSVTPLGSAPVSLNVGTGKPDAVTVKVPAAPAVNVVLFPLVIALTWLIVTVRFAVAVWPAESVTVMVKLKAPLCVGVPESTPAELNVNPVGRAPCVTAHM